MPSAVDFILLNKLGIISLLLLISSLAILICWAGKFITKKSIVWIIIFFLLSVILFIKFWPTIKLKSDKDITTETYIDANGQEVTIKKSN